MKKIYRKPTIYVKKLMMESMILGNSITTPNLQNVSESDLYKNKYTEDELNTIKAEGAVQDDRPLGF